MISSARNITSTRSRLMHPGMWNITAVVLVMWCGAVAACSHSASGPTSEVEHKGQPLQRFKVLTFNALHGLEPSGLTVKASADVIFDIPAEERLPAAMQLLGIDFASLSEQAGHA